MTTDTLRSLLSARTPGRWRSFASGSEGASLVSDKARVARLTSGPLEKCTTDARAIAAAINLAEPLLAVVEAARIVCDPMVQDGGGARWWEAHEDLDIALTALDAAIREEVSEHE